MPMEMNKKLHSHSDAAGVDQLLAELDRHVATWMQWARATPLLCDQSPTATLLRAMWWLAAFSMRAGARALPGSVCTGRPMAT